MAEHIEEAPQTEAPAPETGQANDAGRQNGNDWSDLSSILSEYDAATKPPTATEAPAQPVTPAEQKLGPHGLPLGEQPIADPEAAMREATRDLELSTMKKWAQNIDRERAAELDRKDFGRIVEGANETLRAQLGDKANYLPEGYAEAWLKNQFTIDPDLYAKLNNRYASPEATLLAERATKNAIRSLVDQVKKIPDREATEDRETVAMAVRGTNGKAPPRAAPNYSRMTDREFEESIEAAHGFRPGIA